MTEAPVSACNSERTSASALPLSLDLFRDGAKLVPGAVDEAALAAIERGFGANDVPGVRWHRAPEFLGELLGGDGAIGRIARAEQGSGTRPVRVLLFNKRRGMNWALGLHQDRTIAVREPREVHGFGPWSVKKGQLHVQPPQALVERMLTLRVHLDDVSAEAAPLLVVPGSHRLGRLSEAGVGAAAGQNAPVACLARRGDIWVYATAIVHGSEAYRAANGQRRVLQVDYCAESLPGGLEWALQL